MLLVLIWSGAAQAQVCRLSVAGLNRARRVTGAIHAECPSPVHTAPFGNWGVTSNYGQKGDSHQFDGWRHVTRACDNSGQCVLDCLDGWYEWNSCTDDPLYAAPNCSMYNATGCTEQETATGIDVHGTRTVDIPVRCPVDTNGDGTPDQGGCADVKQYDTGANFMSLYELDPVCCDDLVQTVYFPAATIPLACDAFGCASKSSAWLDPTSWDSPAQPAKGVRANVGARQLGSVRGRNVAPESIASAFGKDLSPAEASATDLPLPTALAGVVVTITDSKGIERPAPLFYISPGQVNFEVPPGVADGKAKVSIFNGTVLRAASQVQVDAIAPGLFTQQASGQGLAAVTALRVASNGAVTALPLGAPIDLRGAGDIVYVSLYGTGIRSRSTETAVAVTIGGMNARVTYAGPQGYYAGLDQVNVIVPHELAGRGVVDVTMTVDSRASNTVQFAIR